MIEELRTLMVGVSQRMDALEANSTTLPQLPVSLPTVLEEAPVSRGESGSMLDDHLTTPVRNKIQDGEYVELSSLLLGYGGLADGISADERKKDAKVLTHAQWLIAFNVYSSCYIERHPDQARGLLKYADNILRLHDLKSDWLGYDRRFRAQRAMLPAAYPWEKLCSDLFLTSMATKGPAKTRATGEKRFSGVCFAFNDDACGRGPACTFQHKCKQCGSFRHGRINCPSYIRRPAIKREDAYPSRRRQTDEATGKDRARK